MENENFVDMAANARFFMGASTPDGFVSYTDELYEKDGEWRAFLIKGGAGTGKASLMRKVFEHMKQRGVDGVSILCSSDPKSLDGVIFPSVKACIVDATTPHVIEPGYWGAVERIVDISSCMDAEGMRAQAREIIAATTNNAAIHARARRFIASAGSLLGDSTRLAAEYTDREKVIKAAAGIATREFDCETAGQARKSGRARKAFLSAVTPEGLITLYDTMAAICPRIYSIEDEYGAAAGVLLDELCTRATAAGYEVIRCSNLFAPNAEPAHLIIPALGVGFTTSNQWHKADFPVYRRIHAARFTDMEALRNNKPLMSFRRRAARELVSEAVAQVQEAKAVHDRMEKLNGAYVDWDGVNRLTARVLTAFDGLVRQ